MFTVALIGPDGAGKTTIGHIIERELPLPVKYLYMGVNADSSNHLLPTARLARLIRRARGKRDNRGPREHNLEASPTKGALRQMASSIKSILSLANRLAEECYRQALAWYYKRRRFIVLFDRHYFPDYYAYDIIRDGRRRPLAQRIHGLFLNHVYPKPDLLVYLDAPAEVLLARKGEGTRELLERRRGDYLQIAQVVKHFVVVDANRPQSAVARDVRACISDFYRSQNQRGDIHAVSANNPFP